MLSHHFLMIVVSYVRHCYCRKTVISNSKKGDDNVITP